MLPALAKFLYSGVTLALAALLAPFFLLSARGRIRLRERFGIWNLPPGSYVWFHGASLGEVNGVLPVIKALRAAYPNEKLLLTATSTTGLDRARDEVDQARLLPFDSAPLYRRALSGAQIKALIVTETELWPALLFEVDRRSVPRVLVNAIVSDYSFPWYRLGTALVSPALRGFRQILCGNSESRDRFIALGASAELTSVSGNSKYDIEPSVPSEVAAQALRAEFFSSEGTVVTLGSLRPGEEAIWFPAIARAIESKPELRFVIAPRHKEKFDFFAARLSDFGITYRRWTSPRPAEGERVVLLDAYGKLEPAYAFSTVAFVGGSLVDFGGHNPLEPACYGCCIAMGPYARNVREIVEDMERKNAILLLKEEADVERLLVEVHTDADALRARGAAARELWRSHRGASKNILRVLEEIVR